ncbi:MAG: DcaP family trimeric outer membrane transporter, partial [Sulfurimonadaceae bacterium]|nr:DcaP family trimeric outer membrane transporter [Sulfurimonadaceae bacterium]
HKLRIRHAYAEVGNWTFGQANSTFNTFVSLDTIISDTNDVFARQPLVRYSRNKGDWGYDVSLEQPETTLVDPDGNIVTPKDDKVPDLAARVRYYPHWGEASVSGLLSYLHQDRATIQSGGGDVVLGNSDSATAWALNASGRIKVGDKDDIRFDMQYGEGLGRYLNYSTFAAGSVDTNGNIELQTSYGGHLGYRHFWSEQLRSTLAYVYIATDNNSGVATDVTKEMSQWTTNVMWSPATRMLVGLEYNKIEKELENGDKGDQDLLQMIWQYDF